jgi:hypothetical protein
MKILSEDAIAALERGDAVVGGAVEILCDPPVRLFSGYGTIEIAGEGFAGIGAHGLIETSGGALGDAAQGMTMTLSALEADVLSLLDADAIKGAPVVRWRLVWSSDAKTLLDAFVSDRGREDTVTAEEEIGGEAAIKVAVETAARGLGRRGSRMRSDADQRLVKANDGSRRNVSYAGEKKIYLGGKIPVRAATALGGTVTAGGGGLTEIVGGVVHA